MPKNSEGELNLRKDGIIMTSLSCVALTLINTMWFFGIAPVLLASSNPLITGFSWCIVFLDTAFLISLGLGICFIVKPRLD